MSQSNLHQMLLSGAAPRNLRILIARGSAPLPPRQMLEVLVFLLKDVDAEVSNRARQTLGSWDRKEIAELLSSADCAPAVLDYFTGAVPADDSILQAIATNPASPGETIQTLALAAPVHLLEKILDNRVRILAFPAILESAGQNPHATPEIRRLIQEIEVEFFGGKKRDYAIDEPPPEPASTEEAPVPEPEVLPGDLSLEGLPVDPEARQAELGKRISGLSVREKVQHALFGTREVRTILIRDTNKEVAKSVLRSPKLTESEIESIAAMRSVAEDILSEIAKSKSWTRSYAVVHNLVRNPKTPPTISQRLMFRLRHQDLMLLSRDRSIPDAVRYHATRALNQRSRPSP